MTLLRSDANSSPSNTIVRNRIVARVLLRQGTSHISLTLHIYYSVNSQTTFSFQLNGANTTSALRSPSQAGSTKATPKSVVASPSDVPCWTSSCPSYALAYLTYSWTGRATTAWTKRAGFIARDRFLLLVPVLVSWWVAHKFVIVEEKTDFWVIGCGYT